MQSLMLALAIALAPIPAHSGEDWDFSAPHKSRCSSGGQQDMNRCLDREYQHVHKRLNATYSRVLRDLQDTSQLRKAQAAWVRFRDLTCEYANSGITKEGTLYPFAQNACLIDLTEKRIRDLEQYLEWKSNGCPPRREAP
jgi:uncharacterized protein YecT (DUF1311 family)